MQTHPPAPAPNNAFHRLVRNGLKFRLFLLGKLPSAYFAGLRVVEVDSNSATVKVPFKWFTRNPFRSTYFACLAMAAEMSTGVLAMGAIYGRKPAVSMLVVGMEARFYKKATGLTRFICTDGAAVSAAVDQALATGEGTEVLTTATGYNEAGEVIAVFRITWSFKGKKK
jgi:hypothetical protein